MNRDAAEILALQALSFIVSDDKARETFMTQTGLDGAEMRAAAATVEFQAGLLEFLGRHENLLMAFCESVGAQPEEIGPAVRALVPHGAHGEWNS